MKQSELQPAIQDQPRLYVLVVGNRTPPTALGVRVTSIVLRGIPRFSV